MYFTIIPLLLHLYLSPPSLSFLTSSPSVPRPYPSGLSWDRWPRLSPSQTGHKWLLIAYVTDLTYRLIWRLLYSLRPPIEASGESSVYRRHDTEREAGHAKKTIDARGDGVRETSAERKWRGRTLNTGLQITMVTITSVFLLVLIGNPFVWALVMH